MLFLSSTFTLIILSLLFLFLCLFNISFIIQLLSFFVSNLSAAPYVPISKNLVRYAFKLIGVGGNDVVFDLGSGDGRVLHLAVKEFGVQKVIGYEIAPWPYFLSKFYSRLISLLNPKFKNKIIIKRKNFYKADLTEATVIFLYLTQKPMGLLRKKFEQEAKPGTRIISARFLIPGWKEKIYDDSQKYPIWIYEV